MSEQFEGPAGNSNPEDFAEFLRKFLAGEGGLDAQELARAAGLPNDPKMLSELASQIQQALAAANANPSAGVNWQLAAQQAKALVRPNSAAVTDRARNQVRDASAIAKLWLGQATEISELTTEAKLLTRELWVDDALPLFQALAQPVASQMSNALSEHLSQNSPQELQGMLGQASNLMKSAGAALFAMQLGQALGKLASEVLTGTEIGLPIFSDQRPAYLAQNVEIFAAGLELEIDQVYLYLAVREMAHNRLFKHSKWLRDHAITQITSYASGIKIDNDKIAEVAGELDVNNLDPDKQAQLREAFESGAFIADRTESQERALESVETLLALIEGWVQVICEQATDRLPQAAAIAEAVQRRRASGGPAEQTFNTLVGLELRPRKMREATEMWRQITKELGAAVRDGLWAHPDLMPTADDIANPSALITRLRASSGAPDELDKELRELLGE
jgi:putative hydrolase